MSIDMFPDAAIDYILNHPDTPGGDVTDDDRIMLDEVPLVLEVNYHNEPALGDWTTLAPGAEPFILFQMRQGDGAIVCEVTASMIESEDELIETLEVFFETMLEERARRQSSSIEGEVVSNVLEADEPQFVDGVRLDGGY